jgi:rhodanese-related sulfurtransferase
MDRGAIVSHSPSEIPVPQITAADLKARLDAGDPLVVLDVRNPDEWEYCTLTDSIKLSLPTLQMLAQQVVYAGVKREDTDLAQLPTDREIVVHCHHGTRSMYAIMMLRELGFDPTRLLNLDGGIDAWSADVDPSVPRY